MATLYSKKNKNESKINQCKCGIKLKSKKEIYCDKCKIRETSATSDQRYKYWKSNGNNSKSKTETCTRCHMSKIIAENNTICLECFVEKDNEYLT